MKYQLTQEDIEKGKPGDPEACAVARCVQRQHPGVPVSVDPDTIEIGNYFLPAPVAVAKFIENYDDENSDYESKPFEFELSI